MRAWGEESLVYGLPTRLAGHSSSPHSLCSRRSGVVRSSGFGTGWASRMLRTCSRIIALTVVVVPSMTVQPADAKQWNGADDRFPQPQGSFFQAPLRSFVGPKRVGFVWPKCADLASRALSQPKSLKVPNSGKPEFGAAVTSRLAGPVSRCQTAHLVPAARSCARGLQPCFAHPESRGGRSAERRSGACGRDTPGAERGALRPITRDARLSHGYTM